MRIFSMIARWIIFRTISIQFFSKSYTTRVYTIFNYVYKSERLSLLTEYEINLMRCKVWRILPYCCNNKLWRHITSVEALDNICVYKIVFQFSLYIFHLFLISIFISICYSSKIISVNVINSFISINEKKSK